MINLLKLSVYVLLLVFSIPLNSAYSDWSPPQELAAVSWEGDMYIYPSVREVLADPAISTDSQGNWHLVYVKVKTIVNSGNTASTIELKYLNSKNPVPMTLESADSNSSWSGSGYSFDTTTFSSLSIVIDHQDNVHIAYLRTNNSGFGSYSSDGFAIKYVKNIGGTWYPSQELANLSSGGEMYVYPNVREVLADPAIGIDSQGNWHVVYVKGKSILYSGNAVYSSELKYLNSQNSVPMTLENAEGGSSWGSRYSFSTTSFSSPSIVIDHEDNVHIGYLRTASYSSGSYSSNAFTVKYIKNIGGTWYSPQELANVSSEGEMYVYPNVREVLAYPAIGIDSQGNWHLVYVKVKSTINSGSTVSTSEVKYLNSKNPASITIESADSSSSGNLYTIAFSSPSMVIGHENKIHVGYLQTVSSVVGSYSSNAFSIKYTQLQPVIKIPLGGEIQGNDNSTTYRIYVPSRWGGDLTVKTDSGVVELYYPDTSTKIAGSDVSVSYSVPFKDAEGNAIDKHGWYYVKHFGAAPFTISNTFVEEGEDSYRPWNTSTWWTFSDKIDDEIELKEIENLYDKDGPLWKYDLAVSSGTFMPATDWEKGKSVLEAEGTKGHYIYNGIDREPFAEKDFKFDWDNDLAIENPGPYDFYDSITEKFGSGDGDLNDKYDSTWWGHCDGWAKAATIFKNPSDMNLKGNFTVENVKALLIEIGMRDLKDPEKIPKKNKNYTEGEWTKEIHEFLQQWIRDNKQSIFGNLKNTSRGKKEIDEIWNHPIWYYAAQMKEKEVGNEKLVDVVLTLKAADDLGHEFREDSDRSFEDKNREGGYGAGAWRYHLQYDDDGDIVSEGSGWDTSAVDDTNTKYFIPYFIHPRCADDVFRQDSGRANPYVIEKKLNDYVVYGEIRRITW